MKRSKFYPWVVVALGCGLIELHGPSDALHNAGGYEGRHRRIEQS